MHFRPMVTVQHFMLEVEPTDGPPEVAKTAKKPSLAALQSHSLGGCTIDELPHIGFPCNILWIIYNL